MIDTSDLTHGTLKERIAAAFRRTSRRLPVTFVAFGFKFGIAGRSRFALRRALSCAIRTTCRIGRLTGNDAAVAAYIEMTRRWRPSCEGRRAARLSPPATSTEGKPSSPSASAAPAGAIVPSTSRGRLMRAFRQRSVVECVRSARLGPAVSKRSFALRAPHWLLPGLGVKRWVVARALGVLLARRDRPLADRRGRRNRRQRGARRHRRRLLSARILDVDSRHRRASVWSPFRHPLCGCVGRRASGARAGARRDFAMRYSDMRLQQGYKIVAIGGGTGLSTLLRGLKRRHEQPHRDRNGQRRRRLVRAGCKRSSASCRRATFATVSSRSPTTKRSSPISSAIASPKARGSAGILSATCSSPR